MSSSLPIDKQYLISSLKGFDSEILSKKYLLSNDKQLHVHANKEVLDKINVSDNGVLLFDGKEISSGVSSTTGGKSAYEIAVENGFVGNEEKWLESLKGKDGISPTIDVYSESDSEYKLKITDKNGSKITPNLKGGGLSSSNEEHSNSINQSTFQNVTKGEEKEIATTSQFEKSIVQAYKFIDGSQNVSSILRNFNSENIDFFNYNPGNILFYNSGVKICNSYKLEFYNYLDKLYISQPFNLKDFVSLKVETPEINLYATNNVQVKPDDSILIGNGKQMNNYEIKEYSLSGCGNPYGLFDGVRSNNFNTKDTCYWQSSGHYLTITFMQPVNIYRSGTYNWATYHANFKILKLDEETSTYTDITSSVNQTTSEVNNDQWELTIEGLPAGTYKFMCTGYRIDTEWFLEESNSSYLLKNNDTTYCICEEYYDTETGQYVPFDHNTDFVNIFCDSLFDYADYLNGLRPIDKFSGDLQIIQKNYGNFLIQGIKSSSELIVSNEDINNGLAETINSITLNHTKNDNANIKIVFSFDSGCTWNTFDGNSLEILNITIPSERFEEFSLAQKEQWENAKETILNTGIGINDFSNIEFNSKLMRACEDNGVAPKTIRIAYVLYQPSYDDECVMMDLKWNYNEDGHFSLMSQTEYELSIYRHKILFKSLINSDLIKLNILS